MHYPSTGYNPASIAVGDLTGAGALGPGDRQHHGQCLDLPARLDPGHLPARDQLATGGAPNQVVIADVDGDGAQDLVLADFSASGSVIVLYQDPANPGRFSRR